MKWIKLDRYKIKVYGKKSKLVIKGIAEDHKAFLHNLFTNDINNLLPNRFNYNLRLKGNGHPIQDFFVFNFGDYFILDTEFDAKSLIDEFNKLKLSMQVFFEDLTDKLGHVFLYGNDVEGVLKQKFGIEISDFEFTQVDDVYIAKNPVRLGEGGFDIFGNINKLNEFLENYEVMTKDEFESIRIKNCIAKIGKELKEGFIPLETPIYKYGIHFNKGCYVGQEAIARIYFRGKTPRTLAKFQVMQNVIEGDNIVEDGKKIGVITSISLIDNIALGYILRVKTENQKEFSTENGGKIRLISVCDGETT